MANAVLSELIWDEGFAIPVPNSENKYLEEEVSPFIIMLTGKFSATSPDKLCLRFRHFKPHLLVSTVQ